MRNGKTFNSLTFHYVIGSHEVVQQIIKDRPEMKQALLNWIKEMEEFVGVDIYGTMDYLLD